MLRRAALASILMILTTAAASAVTEWRGVTALTAITDACAAEGFVNGDKYNTRYRHPNIGGASDETRIVFLQTYSGMGYTIEGPVSKSYKDVQAGYVGSSVYFDDIGVKIRFSSMSPATVDKNTKSIVIDGDVKNFGGITGCDVSFRATLDLRPE